MNPSLMFMLKNIGLSILSSVIVVGILEFIIRKYCSSRIDLSFAKRLERFKHDLDAVGEQSRFDYQRKLQDFNLYTSKRHESYVALHKLLLLAQSSVTGLVGLRNVPTYEDCNQEDISRILDYRKVHSGKKEEILSLWITARGAAIAMMTDYLRMLELQQAEIAIAEARDCFWFSKLYISNDIAATAHELIKKLKDLKAYYNYPEATCEFYGRVEQLRHDVDDLSNHVISIMKKEISVGYYQTIDNNAIVQ